MYGRQSVRVPKSFTEEQAQKFVLEHWNELPLAEGNYLEDSDEPDFEDAGFEEDDEFKGDE